MSLRDRVVFLRCVCPKGGGLPGPLIVLRTSHPLPDTVLLPLDYEELTPLPEALLERVRQDEHGYRNDIGRFAEDVLGVSIPEHMKRMAPEPRTRVVPRRRFVRGRDSITRLDAWLETRIWWVDVAT